MPRAGAFVKWLKRYSDLGVQAALFLGFLFPPPAAGAFRLARRNGAGARRAADRDKALGVQGIDRHAARRHKLRHLVAAPVEQRAELEHVLARLGGDETHILPVGRLIGPQANDPGLRAVERAVERLDLAHETTCGARLARFVEAIDALALDQR